MNNTFDILEPDSFYHIFNRGINSQKTFNSNENYLFFLKQAKKHLIEFVDFYAYCLMPNHYHFIIKVKSAEELSNTARVGNSGSVTNTTGLHSPQAIISKQFGTFFNSYTQAFNKDNNRHGALFERPFKRIRITSDDYLLQSIIYVHQNSLAFSSNLANYPYSSYKSIISNSITVIKRDEVIKLFGDIENFIYCHKLNTTLTEF